MGSLDRFGGPEAWDAHCHEQEKAYEALIEGKTCLDCDRSSVCEYKGHECVGYCHRYDEFVTDEESVKELGLDCFEAEAAA